MTIHDVHFSFLSGRAFAISSLTRVILEQLTEPHMYIFSCFSITEPRNGGGFRPIAGGGPYNDPFYNYNGPPRGDFGPGPFGPYGRGPRPPGGPRGGPPGGGRRGGRRGRDDGPPGVSLLVRNISNDIQTADLQAAFGRIGEVRDVYIPRDYHSQQPKGFAFIELATPEQAREALDEMDRFVMKGRELEVVYAQERRKTPNEMKGRVVDGPDGLERGSRDGEVRGDSFER